MQNLREQVAMRERIRKQQDQEDLERYLTNQMRQETNNMQVGNDGRSYRQLSSKQNFLSKYLLIRINVAALLHSLND